jgi:hypothetical protein
MEDETSEASTDMDIAGDMQILPALEDVFITIGDASRLVLARIAATRATGSGAVAREATAAGAGHCVASKEPTARAVSQPINPPGGEVEAAGPAILGGEEAGPTLHRGVCGSAAGTEFGCMSDQIAGRPLMLSTATEYKAAEKERPDGAGEPRPASRASR